jgi:hypothetical protein
MSGLYQVYVAGTSSSSILRLVAQHQLLNKCKLLADMSAVHSQNYGRLSISSQIYAEVISSQDYAE